MDDFATPLRKFIEENFLFGEEADFSNDDSLAELGIIDSTGVLELVTHLENTYGMTIDDEELVPENLASISNLARFLQTKLAA